MKTLKKAAPLLTIILLLLGVSQGASAWEGIPFVPSMFGDPYSGQSAAEYNRLHNQSSSAPSTNYENRSPRNFEHTGNYKLWDEIGQVFQRAECSFVASPTKSSRPYYALFAWNGKYWGMIGRTDLGLRENARETAKDQLLREAQRFGYCK